MVAGRVVIGEITRAHGVTGGFWVRPQTNSVERGRDLGEVFLLNGDEERTGQITSIEVLADRWLVHLKGVDSRQGAEALHGWKLGVAAADSPALPEGVFYVRDLVGREVVAEDGRALGKLTAVYPTGSNDVYAISGPEGELLFPALKELVLECPRDAKTMKVRVPKGLLEACLARRG